VHGFYHHFTQFKDVGSGLTQKLPGGLRTSEENVDCIKVPCIQSYKDSVALAVFTLGVSSATVSYVA
jgi:hypothetical protein